MAGATEALGHMRAADLQPDDASRSACVWSLLLCLLSCSPHARLLNLSPSLPPHPPTLSPPSWLQQASYRHLIELAVRAGQPRLAVTLCSEAHEAGALRCFALPALAAVQPGTALGNAIDLR